MSASPYSGYRPSALIPTKKFEEAPYDVIAKRKQIVLQHLAEGWSLRHAAEQAGITPPTVAHYRKMDLEFDELMAEAIEMGTDALEDEALRRAKFGVDKPVFYQGEEVGYVREYSDSLLQFLLKARRPEKYTERQRVDVNNNQNTTFTFDTGGSAPENVTKARETPVQIEGTVVEVEPKLP